MNNCSENNRPPNIIQLKGIIFVPELLDAGSYTNVVTSSEGTFRESAQGVTRPIRKRH